MAVTSAGLMSAMAITSAIATTAGAVVSGVQNYQANKAAEAEAKINASQARESIKQARIEESLNSTQRYRAGRHDLAEGANALAGMGMIGTSAEIAFNEGAFNLAEDLSALKYRYNATASNFGTQANMYDQHAKTAAYNRRMGVLASSINTVGTAAKGAYNYMDLKGYHLPTKDTTNRAASNTSNKKYSVSSGGMYGIWS